MLAMNYIKEAKCDIGVWHLSNTLTEFPEILKVHILIECKSGETLGNIVFDEPLSRFEDLIGK